MTLIRRAILAFALIAGLSPAFAQVPPPVPALPDTERRTSYSISGSLCNCSVGFQLYGDSADVANWIEVFVNGVQIQQSGNWTLTSPTGPLASIPRPITDAVLNLVVPQTGTVQIVGARRPRQTSQFQENAGVPARALNQRMTDITATLRELWDKTNDFTGRSVRAPPGETLALLPVLASRASMGACFDSGGNLTSCVAIPNGSFAAGSNIVFTGTNPTTISTAYATAPDIATLMTLNPGVVNNAFLTAPNRAGNFLWTPGNFTALVAADTNNGIYVKANTVSAATGAWVRAFDGTNYRDGWFGTVADGSTDNSAVINTALKVMSVTNPSIAGNLYIQRNAMFASKSLNWNSNANQTFACIYYSAPADTSPGIPFALGTSEQQRLCVNSGFPGNSSGGFTQEDIINAPINPARIVNIAKQLNSTLNNYVTAGQAAQPTATSPVRATPFGVRDENAPRFFATYQNKASLDTLNSVIIQAYNVTDFLAGASGFAGAGSWGIHIPSVGDIIQGQTSGARLVVTSLGTDIINGNWTSGAFLPGELLTDVTTGFSGSIGICGGCATITNRANTPLIFGTDNSGIGVDVATGTASTAFSVGGRLTVRPSQNLAQNRAETTTNAATLYTNADAVSIPSTGRQIVLDSGNRLVSVNGAANGTGSTATRLVDAVGASMTFANAGGVSTNAFNVASVTHSSTGNYAVVFTNALENANYQVSISRSSAADFPLWASKTVNGFTVTNVNSVPTTTDLAGSVDVVVIGGR